ncbi:hypothetical protein FA13DRAFT_1747528 [Coprinellus micaceus]|uniref:Uncharacterized protein n=1 Tax=Coprinellus micaceus TaxID=71717 RepID=A0A4Y7S4I3_COPMI|nr:hypothetical protein FA13DRAFT_1747528 [Coprinellus micaceus]
MDPENPTIQEKFVTSVQFSPTSQRFGSGASTLLTKPLTGQQLWEYDPATYLLKFYNQFCNIIMIATFTGGVQASVLSFMNDLLSNDFIAAELFRPDPVDTHRTRYTFYSLGLMLGLVAVALDIGVAAIAAVNAALACQFSISPPEFKPMMEARLLFCMIILFIAFFLSGLSLILLTVQFDSPFTVFLAVLFFACFIIAAYQPIAQFGRKWVSALRRKPRLHLFSLLASTSAFLVSVARARVPSSWYTITVYGFTLMYHIVVVMYEKSPRANIRRPRRVAAFCVTMLAAIWIGCFVVTLTMTQRSNHYTGMADDGMKYSIAAFSGPLQFGTGLQLSGTSE